MAIDIPLLTYVPNKTIIVEEPKETYDRAVNYLTGKIIGPPQATDKVTVEELEIQNYIGVYEDDKNY